MSTLTILRQYIAEKTTQLDAASSQLRVTHPDPAAAIRNWLAGREFVLFCGAGISIPAPASAPAFLDLRDSAVLAMADILVDRKILACRDRDAIQAAMSDLEAREDLQLSPEFAFGNMRDGVGFEVVSQLLTSCLGRGEPNANHIATRRLVRDAGPRIGGIVTPNFDLYLERALTGVPVRRQVAGVFSDGVGLPVFKPHGSLDIPQSLAVTFDTISRPLKGIGRQTFRELAEGRHVVVVGYSGWDFDLLPLLIHAGRQWGTELLWLLHDDSSSNERVAMAALGLGARITIINSQRQPLLQSLAGVESSVAGQTHAPLRQSFAQTMAPLPADALIAALLNLITPAGVPESRGVIERLGASLLQAVEAANQSPDEINLMRLGLVTAWCKGVERRRAALLGLATARRLGRTAAIRTWERIVAGDDDQSQTAASRLARVERDLDEFLFDFQDDLEPELAARMTRAGLRIERALLLEDLRRHREADVAAREILADTAFPASGVAEDAWIVEDAKRVWELHCLLGSLAARERNVREMETRFCQALEILWSEQDFWDLDSALNRIAHEAGRFDSRCAEAARDLEIRLMRFCGDTLSELVAIEWKAASGPVGTADVDRANELLSSLHIPADERQEHARRLRMMRP